jgi:hypothetical protein
VKGDCVKRVSPSIGRFEIISKKGTNFADNDFIHSVAEKIKEDNKPIILFWFGTCELTAKKGKYIYIRQPPYQNIERCLRSLTDMVLLLMAVSFRLPLMG